MAAASQAFGLVQSATGINCRLCRDIVQTSVSVLANRTPEKKTEPRVDWVSSSSGYKKEETDQPGAPRAKKITKVHVVSSAEH